MLAGRRVSVAVHGAQSSHVISSQVVPLLIVRYSYISVVVAVRKVLRPEAATSGLSGSARACPR